MTIYGSILPGAASIAQWATNVAALTTQEQHRIRVIDWHRVRGSNVSLTARHFGLTRTTVRQWVKRFRAQGVPGLRDRSRRPHRLRQPTTPWQTVARIVAVRTAYPAWSKYKIQALLTREGIMVSTSTIGRILKRKGLISKRVSRRRRHAALHPRARFPRGMKISSPGDMVQMDTKHLMLIEGKKLYQFTAIDVLTKLRVLRVYESESSRNGADFLTQCRGSFPFSIKAVQTDNGAPFLKEFERYCRRMRLTHYFTYPRHPQQNSYVEISHGADEREFYRQGNKRANLTAMQQRLREWQDTWNTVRPHAALNYLTPQVYFERWRKGRLPTRDVITLQT